MVKITTPRQLNSLIDTGGGIIDSSVLSEEMSQLNTLYNSATMAMQQRQLDQAISIYRRIVSTYPDFVAARVNLANCLVLVAKPQEALRELEQAHILAPDDPDIHGAAAMAYESIGDKEQEIQQYSEAIRHDPRNVQAMNNLGATYREVGQLDMARQWLSRALEEVENQDRLGAPMGFKHPGRLQVLYNLALVCQDAQDWRAAAEFWQQCLALDPSNAQFRQLQQQAAMRALSS